MTYGARFYDASGNLTYDSTTDHTLFQIDERAIPASSVGNGVTFTYPDHAGRKVAAFLVSPYGGTGQAGSKVQQCRVSYPSGVPTVTVSFADPNGTDVTGSQYPKEDGYLTVFWTGSPL